LQPEDGFIKKQKHFFLSNQPDAPVIQIGKFHAGF
jgi:hypothetical protein